HAGNLPILTFSLGPAVPVNTLYVIVNQERFVHKYLSIDVPFFLIIARTVFQNRGNYSVYPFSPPLYTFNGDRKSTRLNSSHVSISYAVFCLKQKTIDT